MMVHPAIFQLSKFWRLPAWEIAQWPASLGDAHLAYMRWQHEQDEKERKGDAPATELTTKEQAKHDAAKAAQLARQKFGRPTG